MMNDAINRYGQRKTALGKNTAKIFELMWGQCTISIRTLIKGEVEYEESKKRNDVLWLTNKLRILTSGVDEEADAVDVYFQALFDWTHIRQQENESEDTYQKRLNTATQNLILAGGEDVLYPRKLLDTSVIDKDKPTKDEKDKLIDKVRAMHLLCRSDNRKHGSLISELRKAKDVGRDEWPKKQPNAFKLLVKRANLSQSSYNSNQHPRNNRNRYNQGAQFL